MMVTFPAMRGSMGSRKYYSTIMPLSAVPKLFTFTEWGEFLPEDREQRVLNKKRVPDIARYVVENEEGWLFSSITACYKGDMTFKPSDMDENLGLLELNLTQATFVINDGQHRAAAIKLALEMNPSLGEETISILLFPYEGRGRAQQMFSDLNRFVKKTSKSLDILYDKRDLLSQVTLDVVECVSAFKGFVDKDHVSLPVSSKKLFSLAPLYDATKELLANQNTGEATRNELSSIAVGYWNVLSQSMDDWARVRGGELTARELRQQSIASHSVVLRALGAVGSNLMETDPDNWKRRLAGFKDVDWSKKNREWENINIVANSVVSNRQARYATKAFLKRKVGLDLTEAEERAITPPRLK